MGNASMESVRKESILLIDDDANNFIHNEQGFFIDVFKVNKV